MVVVLGIVGVATSWGKKMVKKLLDVEELNRDGVFDSVAENPPLPVSEELPEVTPIVGLDSIVDRAWNFPGENSVRIMGFYGMGGVGKTTLLKRINNEFSKRGQHSFQNKSKISTQSEAVCGHMEANKIIRVECQHEPYSKQENMP
ncbi:Disease resistance protein rfl1 [Thalictrum thalictroides]|uniref:Disease resistance protein rfl1 n=1 Tax=Thalictrum thalictroides TaxID=46969 RepID=A0A7J6WGK6_THATH|nr:Disease resistance protein rfl1 [Thalictrum thalictroides]